MWVSPAVLQPHGTSPGRWFALLVDPANHAAIDGTGWVRGPLQHPDGDYEIANRVVAFEPHNAIEWEPGFSLEDGQTDSGHWTWRYDLADARRLEAGSTAQVRNQDSGLNARARQCH